MHHLDDLPNVDAALFNHSKEFNIANVGAARHQPRFLLLYGSLRERSYSKLLILE